MKKINLKWDADGDIESYSVYRSETRINSSSLPSPLATGLQRRSYEDIYEGDASILYYKISSIVDRVEKTSSEIIVNLHSSTDTDTPFTISCAGATNSVLYAIALDQYGVDNIEEVGELGQFVINGVSMPMYVDPLDIGIDMLSVSEETVPYPINSGFTVLGIKRLSNLDTSNKTFEIKSSSPHLKFYLWDNPTVNRIDGLLAQHTGVCFSPAETELLLDGSWSLDGSQYLNGERTIE